MNTNETKFCQSCGMPLSDEILGTNADGTKNHDYCIFCLKDGAFTGNFTMEEMAEYCSMFVEGYNKNTGQNLTACQYKDLLRQFYPELMDELRRTLESMDMAYYSPALRSVRNRILANKKVL